MKLPNFAFKKLFRQQAQALVVIIFFGQFLSCYSPAMNHYRKAQNAEQKLDHETAEKEYLLALNESPDDPSIVFSLANLYVKMEKPDLAIEKFKKFLELTADNDSSWSKERWDANFYIEKANQQVEENKPNKKKEKTDEEFY